MDERKRTISQQENPNSTLRLRKPFQWSALAHPRAVWRFLSACSAICPATPALPSYSFNISIQIITACWPRFWREPPPCPSVRLPMACAVEANHVYVIPANVDLTIAGGALKLAPRTQTPGSHMPIDRFFRSVADRVRKPGDRRDPFRHWLGRFGGRGRHQSRGWRDVRAGRGHREVRHHAASRRGHRLRGFRSAAGGHCRRTGQNRPAPLHCECPTAPTASQRQPPTKSGSAASWRILHGATGIDFSRYREKMVKRRILRRLALRNIDGLAEYSERLENDSG